MKIDINRDGGKFSVLFDDLTKNELFALRDSLDEEGYMLTAFNDQKDSLEAALKEALLKVLK